MRGIFQRSFKKFLIRERTNIANGVSERDLCGRLAMYLEEEKVQAGLVGYYVDADTTGCRIGVSKRS
jgi:hypothetical protein